ncbi:MAG: hypothetical protein JOY93_05820 [Acidobacteriales bacterium]|nr:hypothetical protein [Terriglobales bacterium]
MYPRTWAGLTSCYVAGIPFFRHAVEGDLLFTVAMFATPALLHLLTGNAAGAYRRYLIPRLSSSNLV